MCDLEWSVEDICVLYPTMKGPLAAKNLAECILFLACLADENFKIIHLGYTVSVHKNLITPVTSTRAEASLFQGFLNFVCVMTTLEVC